MFGGIKRKLSGIRIAGSAPPLSCNGRLDFYRPVQFFASGRRSMACRKNAARPTVRRISLTTYIVLLERSITGVLEMLDLVLDIGISRPPNR